MTTNCLKCNANLIVTYGKGTLTEVRHFARCYSCNQEFPYCHKCVEICGGQIGKNSSGKKCRATYCDQCKSGSTDGEWSCKLIVDGQPKYEHRHCNKCLTGFHMKVGDDCPALITLKNKQFTLASDCKCGCGNANSDAMIWKNVDDENEYQFLFDQHNNNTKIKQSAKPWLSFSKNTII